MKAAIVTREGTIEIMEIPAPCPGPYEALVDVIACGFCNATDLKLVEGHWPGGGPMPYILGHESVGRVVRLGDKVRNLKPGDMVLNPTVQAYPELGLGRAWGSFVEKGLVTDFQAVLEDGLELASPFDRVQQVVPPQMDPADAVVLYTLQEVYSALQAFGMAPGMDVLIFGDGPVGISMALCARQMGAEKVIISGHHDERLRLGKEMGATHTINSRQEDVKRLARDLAPKGFPLIVDAVGSNEAVQQALDLVADGGHIGIYGYTDQRRATFDWSRAPVRWRLDYMIVPDLDRLVESHDVLVDWIMSGKVNTRALVTHRLPLEDIQSAYRLAKERQGLKAVVEM